MTDRPRYDRIGLGYATTRRPDPRIGRLVRTALGSHPGEGLEQELESGAVVNGVLGRGACPRLVLGELPVALTPVHL